MKKYLSSTLHHTANAINFLSKIIIVLAVMITTIQLFRYVTASPDKKVSFKEARDFSHSINQSELDIIRTSDENGDFLADTYSSIICSTAGQLCGSNDDKLAYEESTLYEVSQYFLFPIENPPASGLYSTYVAIDNAGIIPSALAQSNQSRGLGFAMIDPISGIWKQFRNISFLLIALYMLAIGFMIMFRMKINAQTVITIENSIPRIILTLILIAFSFAIAGFLIDFMYLLIGLIASVFGALDVEGLKYGDILEKYMFADGGILLDGVVGLGPSSSPFWGFKNVLWNLPGSIIGILGNEFQLIISFVGGVAAWYFILAPLSKRLSEALNVEVEGEFSIVALAAKLKITKLVEIIANFSTNLIFVLTLGALLGLVFAKLAIGFVILLSAMLLATRIFVMLLRAYIQILLSIIFAPFILLNEVFPGKGTFKKWFRNLLSELATFPIVITIFLIGAVLIKSGFLIEGCSFTDSLGDSAQHGRICEAIAFPFFRGLSIRAFTTLVGFGLLFVTPEWVNLIKGVINPDPVKLPTASIGSFFGAVGAAKAGAIGISKYTGAGGVKWGWTAIKRRLPEGVKKKVDKFEELGK